MEIGDQGIDCIGRRLHGEAALDVECVGLRQGEDEDAHDSDREQGGDDGNGFQHEWLPGYGLRTKGGGRARQGEAEIFGAPEAGPPYFTFAPCLAPPLAPFGRLSRIRRSRCIRMWAASADVLARAMARSKAMRASSLRPSCIRKAPRTPK